MALMEEIYEFAPEAEMILAELAGAWYRNSVESLRILDRPLITARSFMENHMGHPLRTLRSIEKLMEYGVFKDEEYLEDIHARLTEIVRTEPISAQKVADINWDLCTIVQCLMDDLAVGMVFNLPGQPQRRLNLPRDLWPGERCYVAVFYWEDAERSQHVVELTAKRRSEIYKELFALKMTLEERSPPIRVAGSSFVATIKIMSE